jgi:hypothetical protein
MLGGFTGMADLRVEVTPVIDCHAAYPISPVFATMAVAKRNVPAKAGTFTVSEEDRVSSFVSSSINNPLKKLPFFL